MLSSIISLVLILRAAAQLLEDNDVLCEDWARNGECSINPEFMMQECAMSCRSFPINATASSAVLAQTTEQTVVESKEEERLEDHDVLCKSWAQMGECTSNPTAMLDLCAKSCREEMAKATTNEGVKGSANAVGHAHADEDFEDEDADCLDWARRGEFDLNPEFMEQGCAKSCHVVRLERHAHETEQQSSKEAQPATAATEKHSGTAHALKVKHRVREPPANVIVVPPVAAETKAPPAKQEAQSTKSSGDSKKGLDPGQRLLSKERKAAAPAPAKRSEKNAPHKDLLGGHAFMSHNDPVLMAYEKANAEMAQVRKEALTAVQQANSFLDYHGADLSKLRQTAEKEYRERDRKWAHEEIDRLTETPRKVAKLRTLLGTDEAKLTAKGVDVTTLNLIEINQTLEREQRQMDEAIAKKEAADTEYKKAKLARDKENLTQKKNLVAKKTVKLGSKQ